MPLPGQLSASPAAECQHEPQLMDEERRGRNKRRPHQRSHEPARISAHDHRLGTIPGAVTISMQAQRTLSLGARVARFPGRIMSNAASVRSPTRGPATPVMSAFRRATRCLDVDYNDSAGNAKAFRRQHPLSCPSYQLTSRQL